MSAQFPPDRTRLISRREVIAGLAMLSAAGVARVSWATLLFREAMARFEERLASLES